MQAIGELPGEQRLALLTYAAAVSAYRLAPALGSQQAAAVHADVLHAGAQPAELGARISPGTHLASVQSCRGLLVQCVQALR